MGLVGLEPTTRTLKVCYSKPTELQSRYSNQTIPKSFNLL